MKKLLRYSLTFILLQGACGETKTVVTEEVRQLVELDEATSEQCPMGGTLLVTGLDGNGNGVLDDDEISSTRVICDGTDGTDGRTSLIRTTEEAPGANCSQGGVRVQHGLDDDGDGLLDDDEVDGTEYVCNGLPGTGTNSLVNVVEEPAGANCTTGGFAIQSGPDDNGDSLLQPGEIQNTVFVCHGASGAVSLVRREDEPAGGNCPYGGQRVLTGIDGDGNGYLDDMEASSSFYVCNGADGVDGTDGVDATANLVDVVPEPPGTDCSTGGVRVLSGPDDDHDGQLDASEVQAEQVVCHGVTGSAGSDGADGLDSLAAVTAEPVGVNCAEGGQKIETGLDLDRDHVLDAGEVTATRYVCHGADGTDGTDGHDSLVTVTAEAAGVNCLDGGQKIETGLDLDDDGVLDIGEITTTRYVCNGAQGDAGADGGIRLLRATNAAKGGVCFFGGVKLETGIDDDGDGVLSDPEVDQTQYVCNLPDIFVSLSAGGYGACGLKANGTIWCWGYGDSLGSGVNADRAIPGQVAGSNDNQPYSMVSHQFWHSCAIMNTFGYCWGVNGAGTLGDGTNTTSYVPVKVLAINPSQISVGGHFSCAIDRYTFETRCWGSNNNGQLGNGGTADSNVPVLVSGLSSGVTSVHTGFDFTCALKTDGSVWCWGNNVSGQLGNNSTTNSNVPVQVSGLTTGVQAVSTGNYHACAIRANNAAWCWGRNGSGQLGDGTTTNRLAPVWMGMATLGTNVARVAAGGNHTCAQLTTGPVYCTGSNVNGQIGDGTTTSRQSPVLVSGLASGVTALSVGVSHSCVLKTDGSAWCWGTQVYGSLGNGLVSGKSLTPTPVMPSDSAL